MQPQTDRKDRRGFSLVESLVTLAIVTVVMLGLFLLLDSASRLSKQETNVADAQAGGRSGMFELARVIRQARSGQLFFCNSIFPYKNNAASSDTLTDSIGNVHNIRPGTDSIEVRGVIYGDIYQFDPNDVSGSGATVQVTIKQVSNSGVTNYPVGGKPSIATRTAPFYFVFTTAEFQTVPVGSNQYKVSLYFVGKVSPTFTITATTVTFTMDTTDAGAQKLNALSGPLPPLQRAFAGGIADDVIFFVDRGVPDPGSSPVTYSHPFLAQALLDATSAAGSPKYNIQPIVDEAEDFQVAYGVDGGLTGALPRDRGVAPEVISTTADADEWIGNVAGEGALTPAAGLPLRIDNFVDASIASTGDELATPALKSIMLSLVVKSAEPDLGYRGAGWDGVKAFDSTAVSLSAPIAPVPPATSSTPGTPFRRRVQTMAVSLRNYL